MSSDDGDASCSDCKLELIEKQWTQLLINWINKCVSPKRKVNHLDLRSLIEVVNRYKSDICTDNFDLALLTYDDVEPFIKYKYPILRLRYLSEEKDLTKKLYIMSSILLYHCCINSQTGAVDHDICSKLEKEEQELIIMFCENLSEMEITINNVDCAIKEAYETVSKENIRYDSSISTQEMNNKMIDGFTTSDSAANLNDEDTTEEATNQSPTLKFKSSVTVLPSVVADTSSYTKSDSSECPLSKAVELEDITEDASVAIYNVKRLLTKEETTSNIKKDSSQIRKCQPGCACTRCSASGPCCGELGTSMEQCENEDKEKSNQLWWRNVYFNWWTYLLLVLVVSTVIIAVILIIVFVTRKPKIMVVSRKYNNEEVSMLTPNAWQCENHFCQKMYQPSNATQFFTSLSRCSLICMGPQLWPYPIGYTFFSKRVVALSTNKLEYKFQSLPSEYVHQHLAEAFKLFIGDLVKLEKIDTTDHNETDLSIKKMNIIIVVDSDPDPRMRYNTDESYTLKVESLTSQVLIEISSPSFCGVRHGLETLSQMILLDQSTGFLITLSNSFVKDAPSYKYRGLMLDTARNYIPVQDLMRTIDAMAMVKLNTFHWRISDASSFPLYLPELPKLFEYGAYDRSMIYTKQDVKSLVHRAGIRGIRVVIEVAAPGPIGRAWAWSPDANCPKKNDNFTCDNILCLRLKMRDSIFDILQTIYTQILDLTKVDDVFHLSDGLFSLSSCYILIDDREGFLVKALDRLRLANKGFLPKLPIIWYTSHLTRDLEAMTWDKYGVQLNEWVQNSGERFLERFKVIHSSRWDLSCQMKKQRCKKYRTWQEMYAWKSWRNIEVFSIEGGEAVLWTDLVDTGNLDYHLWPRVSAVAERLWSDIVANASANAYTYVRLDAHGWRMLIKGVKVMPVWPIYCSYNPISCTSKLK